MKFDWDPNKAASNESKHGVSFGEAATVFADGSSRRRYIVVVHTDRDDRVRIIGARLATSGEVSRYEEG